MDYLGKDIPKLGFGLMRLPHIEKDVDIPQLCEMVDMFLDAGFTYFDTARVYQDSEKSIGKALVERYPRESFQLATKAAAWIGAKDAAEAQAVFDTSLEETGAGYFDFYLLHNIGNARTKVFEDFGMWEFIAQKKEQGLIKHMGFSFHDKADVLDAVLTEHPEAEFVQLQVNYADWDNPNVQAGACCEVARKHGKPVVIMEPVKGGLLANPPEKVANILHEANPDASYASWAMRFAASQDNIITVLSGMSSIEQMRDNIDTLKDFKPLDENEKAVIKKAQDIMAQVDLIPCTNCRYCMKGCPKNISIPGIFSAVNSFRTYGNLEAAKGGYAWESSQGAKGSECIECGQCENACPQHIGIIAELKAAVELLEDKEKTA